MSTLPRLRARLAAIASFAALLAAACNADSNGPSSAALADLMGGATGSGFTVLANAAVTCTNGTITGDVGTFQATPTGSFTQTLCPVTGTSHIGDAAAIAAYNAFLAAYTALAPKAGDVCPIITGTLAAQTFAPGIYCVSAEAKTGVLTLNGPPTGTWTFKVAPGAFTGTNFAVVMAGGGQPCNVTWWVDAAATMTTSAFQGNILAGAGITFTGGTLNGNAWAGADGVGDVTFTGTAVVGCDAAGSPICRVSKDRVTGGGWIRGPSNAKATFGVSGRFNSKKNAFRGQLEFNDHGSNGPKVKGTGVTAYVVVDALTRRIEGSAKVNGVAGFTYEVVVSDKGEPGRNDGFAIRLWNAAGALVYSASGTLRGGNIQLHIKRDGRGCNRDRDRDDDDDDDDDHDGDDDDDDDDDDDHDDRHGN